MFLSSGRESCCQGECITIQDVLPFSKTRVFNSTRRTGNMIHGRKTKTTFVAEATTAFESPATPLRDRASSQSRLSCSQTVWRQRSRSGHWSLLVQHSHSDTPLDRPQLLPVKYSYMYSDIPLHGSLHKQSSGHCQSNTATMTPHGTNRSTAITPRPAQSQ